MALPTSGSTTIEVDTTFLEIEEALVTITRNPDNMPAQEGFAGIDDDRGRACHERRRE